MKRKIKSSYRDLLNTEEWYYFSRLFIEDMGSSCSVCGSDQHLQVHHACYREGLLPWEYDEEDLGGLCKGAAVDAIATVLRGKRK